MYLHYSIGKILANFFFGSVLVLDMQSSLAYVYRLPLFEKNPQVGLDIFIHDRKTLVEDPVKIPDRKSKTEQKDKPELS